MDKETIIEKLTQLQKETKNIKNRVTITEIISDVMSLEITNKHVLVTERTPVEKILEEIILETLIKAGFYSELRIDTPECKYELAVYSNITKENKIVTIKNDSIETILGILNMTICNFGDVISADAEKVVPVADNDNLRKLLREEFNKLENVLSAKNEVFEGNISTLMDMYFEKHLKPKAEAPTRDAGIEEEDDDQEECNCEHCVVGRAVGNDKQSNRVDISPLLKEIFGAAGVDVQKTKLPFQEVKRPTMIVNKKVVLEELAAVNKALGVIYEKEKEYDNLSAVSKRYEVNVNLMKKVLESKEALTLRRDELLNMLTTKDPRFGRLHG